MAVYKKTYRPYDGPLTSAWARFFVIPRYGFDEVRRSRILGLLLWASAVYPLIAALIIYLHYNVSALQILRIDASRIITINERFFATMLAVQSMLAFFMAAFVGPGQISPDLANNGLPLYLARPFSRAEYVGGKMFVLVALLSIMTWLPGLLLFGLQAYLEPAWVSQNWRIAWALFAGGGIWVLLVSLLALALSAWVKWKPAAGALLFGTFFVASGFAVAINAVWRTKWGHLMNISYLMGHVWSSLFKTQGGVVFFRVPESQQLPVWTCWVALFAICGFCLWLLARKIRGAEVVR